MSKNLIILPIICCLITQDSIAQNLYKDPIHKFSIEFPNGWEIKGSQQQYTVIKAVKRSSGGRITLIAIAKYQMVPFDIWDLKPKDLLQEFKEEYPTAEVKMVESGRTKINGVKAVWSIVSVRPPERPQAILSLTYHVMRGSTQFRISGTTNGNEAWFEQEKPILQRAIETFRLTD